MKPSVINKVLRKFGFRAPEFGAEYRVADVVGDTYEESTHSGSGSAHIVLISPSGRCIATPRIRWEWLREGPHNGAVGLYYLTQEGIDALLNEYPGWALVSWTSSCPGGLRAHGWR